MSLFDLRHPIVLGAFGGVSSVELTAIVTDEGGLGSYGLYGYDAERIRRTADELRTATSGPFALNLWLPRGDETETVDADAFARYAAILRPYFDAVGVEPPAAPPARFMPSFGEQLEAVLQARPAVVSFVFGVPAAETIAAAHNAGIRVMGTATTLDEARALDAAGVDAIVASGAESGGHRVSFLQSAEDSLVPLAGLVPAVAAAVDVPVIAAGGIGDAAAVHAALELGADAVMVGSAFLATDQSAAAPAYRAALRHPESRPTVLTRVMSGRLARGIPNRVVDELEAVRDELAPFPVQNWLTGQFRRVASSRDDADLLSLWAGQSSAPRTHTDARELFRALAAIA